MVSMISGSSLIWLYVAVSLHVQNNGLAATIEDKTTFAVAPVNASVELLPLTNVSAVAERLASDLRELKLRDIASAQRKLNRSDEDIENAQKTIPKLQFETGEINHPLVGTDGELRHGFFNTILTAYNKHFPLVLSPDDIWLQIALSVADFLGNDPKMAEKYRETFVDHGGKQELRATVAPTIMEPTMEEGRRNKEYWIIFTEKIAAQISAIIKTDISRVMTSPFSTSRDVEKTVMQITLMESMKNYFEYVMVFACGIPEITLEGRVDDYDSIIERIDKLRKIIPDLDDYLSRIRKHLAKIRDSKAGIVDRDWWRQMVKLQREGSGRQTAFDGWIVDFISTCSGKHGGLLYQEFDKFAVTNTPAIFEDEKFTHRRYNMTLSGGFLGVSQDAESKAVRPVIGWLLYYNGDGDQSAWTAMKLAVTSTNSEVPRVQICSVILILAVCLAIKA